MTPDETLLKLRQAGKKIGRTHLYTLLKTLGIKPLAARQRPQAYPPDTAERILAHFGRPAASTMADVVRHCSTPPAPPKLISLRALKGIRKQAKGGAR